MGEIIKGKTIADKIKLDISEFVNLRKANNLIIPKIASILVGEDGGSIYYINNQEKISKSLGVGFEKILFPSFISEEELIDEIITLNNREDISGIILQLPLPKDISKRINFQ